MPLFETEGVQLFYTDDGAGDPPLLLVHGWTCDSHDWMWQIGPFSEHHRVVVPDLRGHGQSSTPRDGFAPSDFAGDLASLVVGLGLQRVVVVGHSMGAIIASVFAVEHPDLVRAVVVVDPPYGLEGEAASDARAFAAALVANPSGEIALARLGLADDPASLSATQVWRRRRALAVEPQVLARAAQAVHLGENPIAERPGTEELIKHRRVPVLAFHTSPAQGEWEESQLSHSASEVHVFAGHDHWLHQQVPDRFNSLVLQWLGELSGEES